MSTTSLQFFAIPAIDSQAAQADLNAFMAAHRVVAVDRQWLAAGLDSRWAVCVTVAAGPGLLPAALKAGQAGKAGAAFLQAMAEHSGPAP